MMVMYDQASLISDLPRGTELLQTTVDAGWTSTIVERQRCSSNLREFETHLTPDTHLVVQLEGNHQLEEFRNGRWHSATYHPGAVGLSAGGTVERLRSSSQSDFDMAHVYVAHQLLTEGADTLRRAGQRSMNLTMSVLKFDDPAVASIARALLAAAQTGAPDLYAEQAMLWLVTHLLVNHGNADAERLDLRRHRLVDARLSRVIDQVRARYAEQVSLDVLAAEAGLSKFHFVRLFRERTGKSPYVFLVDARMSAARRLLVDTGLPIAEIARQTGYLRPVQFGAAFKQRHGITPTQFRLKRGVV